MVEIQLKELLKENIISNVSPNFSPGFKNDISKQEEKQIIKKVNVIYSKTNTIMKYYTNLLISRKNL